MNILSGFIIHRENIPFKCIILPETIDGVPFCPMLVLNFLLRSKTNHLDLLVNVSTACGKYFSNTFIWGFSTLSEGSMDNG